MCLPAAHKCIYAKQNTIHLSIDYIVDSSGGRDGVERARVNKFSFSCSLYQRNGSEYLSWLAGLFAGFCARV